MRLIKLTDIMISKTIYLNVEQIVAFWEYDGETIIITSNGDEIRTEKSPEQILKMLNSVELTKNIKRLMEYA